MPECREVVELSDGFVDSELAIGLTTRVLHHLAQCSFCAAIIGEKVRLKSMVRSSVKRVPVPPALRERVWKRIGELDKTCQN